MPDTDDKSLPALVSELWQLTIDYAKQETLDPLKSLGRFVGFGAGGAFMLGLGLVLLLIGVLRVLQTETGTTFTGSLSWVPYLICTAGCLVFAGLAMVARGRKPDRGPDRKANS